MGNPRTVQTLRSLVLATNPSLSFLCETKLRAREFTYRFYFPNLQYHFVVEANGCHSGLILFWSLNINLYMASYSSSHIKALILDDLNNPLWKFISSYGNLNTIDNHLSWQLIDLLCSRNYLPLFIGGNWNKIISSSKKWGGVQMAPSLMLNFSNTLQTNGLSDLGF